MPPLKSHVVASTATALASWEHQQIPKDVEDDRASVDMTRVGASLRFVHFAGFWSHFDIDDRASSWPLPPSEQMEQLAEFAAQHGVIASSPAIGDVFLLASLDGQRYIRAGIIATVEAVTATLNDGLEFVCNTIEGEFDGELGEAVEGDVALDAITARFVRRRLSPALGDCFIRWCDLAAQESPATVDHELPDNVISLDRARASRAQGAAQR
jgi:hypothetical protein